MGHVAGCLPHPPGLAQEVPGLGFSTAIGCWPTKPPPAVAIPERRYFFQGLSLYTRCLEQHGGWQSENHHGSKKYNHLSLVHLCKHSHHGRGAPCLLPAFLGYPCTR